MSASSLAGHAVRNSNYSLVLAGLLTGMIGGCTPVRLAQSPIEQSDAQIATALAGRWQGTRYDRTFESVEPSGTMIFKSLPKGRSLVQWTAPDRSLTGVGVVSWTEHEGAYLGIVDGFLEQNSINETEGVAFANGVYLLEVSQDGLSFQPVAGSILYDSEKVRASLNQHNVNYRVENGRLVVDDAPEAMLRWIRTLIDKSLGEARASNPYVVYRRVASASEIIHPNRECPCIAPVIAPRPD